MKYFLIILVLMAIAHWTNSSACTLHVGDWTKSDTFGELWENGVGTQFNVGNDYYWTACTGSQI